MSLYPSLVDACGLPKKPGLDGESLLRGAAKLRKGERIDLGVRLFSGHILASDHESDAGEAIPAEKSLKQGFDP